MFCFPSSFGFRCSTYDPSNLLDGVGFGVARGVDFKGVKAVINFDFPLTALNYTHRIGRTARGGEVGMALSFVTPADEEALAEVVEYQSGAKAFLWVFPFRRASFVTIFVGQSKYSSTSARSFCSYVFFGRRQARARR